jgi:pilus assembly protein CpaB
MARALTIISGTAIVVALLGTVEWHIARNDAPARAQTLRAGQAKGFDLVTAQIPIRRGTRIGADMLSAGKTDKVPKPGTFAAIEQANGRVALSNIARGAALGTFNTTNNSAKLGLAPLIPKGMRATTIQVSDDIAVGNWIQAGDRVDVLLIGTSGQRTRGADPSVFREGEARLLLQNVTVLAVGDSLVGEPTNNHRYRTVTLAVTPKNALLIALAGSVGTYHLSLRARDDSSHSPDFVVTTKDFGASHRAKARPSGTTGAVKKQTIEVITGRQHSLVPVGGAQ